MTSEIGDPAAVGLLDQPYCSTMKPPEDRETTVDVDRLLRRALMIKNLYDELNQLERGRTWTNEEFMLGFVGGVGDLAKLVMAQEAQGPGRDAPASGRLPDGMSICSPEAGAIRAVSDADRQLRRPWISDRVRCSRGKPSARRSPSET